MSDTKQLLLKMLEGHDSKSPLAFRDILTQCTLGKDAALQALIELNSSGQVNCALITRQGASDHYYWPTGVVRTIPLRDYKITNTHRRTDQPKRPAATAPEKEEQPMQQAQPTTALPTKTQRIITYLLEHRTAFGSELCKIAETTSPGAFLKSYINRGIVIVSESTDRKHGKTYTLREGVTIEDIDKVRLANPVHQAAAPVQSKQDQETLTDVVPRFTVVPQTTTTPQQLGDALAVIQQAIGKGLILRVSEFGMVIEDLHRNTYEITAEDAEQTIQAIRLLEAKRAA